MTRPAESQDMPDQDLQQSEVGVHVFNRFEGSYVILFLKCSNASLSTALQDFDDTKNGKEK